MKRIYDLLIKIYNFIRTKVKNIYENFVRQSKEADPQSWSNFFIVAKSALIILLVISGILLGIFSVVGLILMAAIGAIEVTIEGTTELFSWLSQYGNQKNDAFYIVLITIGVAIFYSATNVKIVTPIVKFLAIILICLGLWSVASNLILEIVAIRAVNHASVIDSVDSISQPDFLDEITADDFIQEFVQREKYSLWLLGLGGLLGIIGEISSSVSYTRKRNSFLMGLLTSISDILKAMLSAFKG